MATVNRACWLLGLLLLLTAEAWSAPVTSMMAPEAFQLLQRQPDTFLLDVRTPGEYLQLRLAGATLIPIDQFQARSREVPKDRPVLVYCAVGSRSSQVANYLASQGYPEVYNLTGGIWGWQLRGYPVIQGPP
ncbi:rhodanese-like domain-containing protein [Desulfuromonas carbonis]|uniref:rhodanese-like domain-containing protein n=1 Tax=Desulfuromonas sp. DDH964 TaxID=1823759 RepID=UPI00078B9500|nr:rhodanese-like domain-containing protein [Desulfuromonas sp. DDH964]AMV72986.1 rhodanese-like domain-containing protein [Desulfuromonas sp. DDH964]